ncbi:MAG TPA: hypothetical protein VKW08_00180 [Xanthobacteraceae bacterium]|jgi:hypothetical protein|nr:hypothetical protein [Xanthobacteraceae bacterium]
MIIKKRMHALMLSAFAGAMVVPGYALAQDAQTERLQQQVNSLQSQLQVLQREIAESKKTSQSAGAAAYAASKPLVKAPPPSPVKLTWGGFLAAETVFRQHNTVSDMGTPFTSIPYPSSPQYGEHEFRGSARASRISLLAEGAVDPMEKLAGYFEMDFLGAGITSNYNQSNSWDMRLRQAYFTYDNSDWGFHLLAGQAWSLITQNTVGITPRKENIPLTIEANYVAGFNYTRGWQLRLVKDFGPTAAVGVSFEVPAELVYSSTGAIANNGSLNGLIVNWANPGNTFLGSSAFVNNFNTETAPDIIGKAAFDPGWGHFEVLGLVRFFTDNVMTCTPASVAADGVCADTSANILSQSSKVTVGEGVGGSVLLPIVPKLLDLQASALYGRGIGRYGASQLSDVVVSSDGTLSPITALHVLAGAVVHATPALDIYGYGGFERADSNLFGTLAGTTGFGNPSAVNTGCGFITAAQFASPAGSTNCAAINKEVDMVTVGFWQNLLKGSYGRLAAGAQWEYIQRKSFDTIPGNGGAVSTNDNVFLTSLRYYPF